MLGVGARLEAGNWCRSVGNAARSGGTTLNWWAEAGLAAGTLARAWDGLRESEQTGRQAKHSSETP